MTPGRVEFAQDAEIVVKNDTEMRLSIFTAIWLSLACFAPVGAETLRVGVADLPAQLDPALDRSPAGDAILPAMCDTLVALDATGRPVPALATGWIFAADLRTLTLDLRDDAKFADGSKVDAASVKASLDRARTHPQSARRAELGAVVAVEIETPTRLRLRLDRAYAPLPVLLAGRAGMVAPPAGDANDESLCAGPYRVAGRAQDGTLVLARNDAHWARDAYRYANVAFVPVTDPALRLARLRAGALDLAGGIAPADIAELAGDRRVRAVAWIEPGWRAILFNLSRGPRSATRLGREADLRRAVGRALDRDALVREAASGPHLPGDQWSSPDTPFHAASTPDVPPTGDATGLSFELTVPARGEDIAFARAIAAQAKSAGIEIRLAVHAPAVAAQRVQNGDFEAALVAWRGRPDPDANVYAQFHCRGARNDTGICNPALDAALDAARATADEGERREHYSRALAALRAQAPAVFLHHRARVFAQSTRLTDFAPAADGGWNLRGLRPRD